MKVLTLLNLFIVSSVSIADSNWVSLGKNMFDHQNIGDHKNICIEGKTYEFKEAERKKGKFKLKYIVIDLKPKPQRKVYSNQSHNYKLNTNFSYDLNLNFVPEPEPEPEPEKDYKKAIGYLGVCAKDRAVYKTEKNIVKDTNQPFIQSKISELLKYTSERNDDLSKSITSGESIISARLETKKTLLPDNRVVIDRCLNLFSSNDVDAMYVDRIITTDKGKKQFSQTEDLVVRYPCDCDGGPSTTCPEINSFGDSNGDSIPEVVEFYNSGESDCVRVLELKDSKLQEVFNGTFYNGPC